MSSSSPLLFVYSRRNAQLASSSRLILSIDLYVHIYIYTHVALCFYVYSSSFDVNYFPARLPLLHVESKFSLPVLTPLSYFLASFSLMGRGRARSFWSHITDGERTVVWKNKVPLSRSVPSFSFSASRAGRVLVGERSWINFEGKEETGDARGIEEWTEGAPTRATWECARLVKEERASVTAHAALLTTPGVVPPRRKAEPRW